MEKLYEIRQVIIISCYKLKWTPLHYAAKWGHKSTVKILLHHKAEINILDARKRTPLHLASYIGTIHNIHHPKLQYLDPEHIGKMDL